MGNLRSDCYRRRAKSTVTQPDFRFLHTLLLKECAKASVPGGLTLTPAHCVRCPLPIAMGEGKQGWGLRTEAV